jgi:hypothetical protein
VLPNVFTRSLKGILGQVNGSNAIALPEWSSTCLTCSFESAGVSVVPRRSARPGATISRNLPPSRCSIRHCAARPFIAHAEVLRSDYGQQKRGAASVSADSRGGRLSTQGKTNSATAITRFLQEGPRESDRPGEGNHGLVGLEVAHGRLPCCRSSTGRAMEASRM